LTSGCLFLLRTFSGFRRPVGRVRIWHKHHPDFFYVRLFRCSAWYFVCRSGRSFICGLVLRNRLFVMNTELYILECRVSLSDEKSIRIYFDFYLSVDESFVHFNILKSRLRLRASRKVQTRGQELRPARRDARRGRRVLTQIILSVPFRLRTSSLTNSETPGATRPNLATSCPKQPGPPIIEDRRQCEDCRTRHREVARCFSLVNTHNDQPVAYNSWTQIQLDGELSLP
jgi:hypothetical protein